MPSRHGCTVLTSTCQALPGARLPEIREEYHLHFVHCIFLLHCSMVESVTDNAVLSVQHADERRKPHGALATSARFPKLCSARPRPLRVGISLCKAACEKNRKFFFVRRRMAENSVIARPSTIWQISSNMERS